MVAFFLHFFSSGILFKTSNVVILCCVSFQCDLHFMHSREGYVCILTNGCMYIFSNNSHSIMMKNNYILCKFLFKLKKRGGKEKKSKGEREREWGGRPRGRDDASATIDVSFFHLWLNMTTLSRVIYSNPRPLPMFYILFYYAPSYQLVQFATVP